MNNEHPEQQALSDYALGKLDEQRAAAVGSHVANCPVCEVTLQSIEGHADTLVSGLRGDQKSAAENFAREEAYQRAIEHAANLPEVTAIHGQPTKISSAPPGAADEYLAKKLGPYELLAKLGEGGMGAVYRAQHEHLGKTVAIKILPAAAQGQLRGGDSALVGRFRREMKAVGALHHPNIVGAHDAGEAGGVHFLVMEYIAGKDLSTILKEQGPLSVEQAISCTLQAARGLEFAHHKGIVHRDIKPANLLLDEEGTLKILDMGLARLDDNVHNIAAQEGLTQSGQVMGTVDYMAPEQAFDTHRADAKADVYSLGCTLYRLLTGQNVFAGDTIVQKILAHREKPIPSLRTARPEVPAALDQLFQRMLAKHADERIGMSDVVKELTAFQTSTAPATESFNLKQSPLALSPTPTLQSGEGKKKIPGVLLAAGFGAAAALVLLAVVFIIRDKDGKEISRVNGPEGSSVTVQEADKKTKHTPFFEPSTSTNKFEPSKPVIEKNVFAEWEKQLSASSVQEFEKAGIKQSELQRSEPEYTVVTPSANSLVAAVQKFGFESPDFAAWATDVARRDAETQRAMVIKKLQELNPGYDGKETHQIQNNSVVELVLPATKIADLSPVRALADLKILKVGGEDNNRGLLKSLAPLQGMKLEKLEFYYTDVADLAPLRGMPLTGLICFATKVTDLGPLTGMPLSLLWINENPGITDLRPLRGAPLETLFAFNTGISDLTPLADAPLEILRCNGTSISDLTPLRGKDIMRLEIAGTKVTYLAPLEKCGKLKRLEIQGLKIPADEIEQLQKALPNCQITADQEKTTSPVEPAAKSE